MRNGKSAGKKKEKKSVDILLIRASLYENLESGT